MRSFSKSLRIIPLLVLLTTSFGVGISARAQGWDYGRNMFGFAQRPPGGVWSSYYHPDFDPDAWYPAITGNLTHHNAFAARDARIVYPPSGGIIVRSSPGLFSSHSHATPYRPPLGRSKRPPDRYYRISPQYRGRP